MRSSWPILIGIAFIATAAFWYDATNQAVAAPGVSADRAADTADTAPSQARAEARLLHP